VKARLGADLACPVVIVGGTNGKGSTCAFLESLLTSAGHRTGVYTSPHLLRYAERVRIGAQEVDESALCAAFAAVEAARGDVSLTYFEFGTLAAAWLFARENVDAAVLEVGLGGRLDAVNVFDADVAVVTSVDLDHQDWLGDTREDIGREKAGIFRPGRVAICADPAPPAALVAHARAIGADLRVIGQAFSVTRDADGWRFEGRHWRLGALPWPRLRGDFQLGNAGAALATLEALAKRLPVPPAAISEGLRNARVTGRFEVLPGRPAVILDVAHNPHAARALAANLATTRGEGRTFAVFAMLADKDIAGVAAAVRGQIDHWLVAGLDVPRGASAQTVLAALAKAAPGAPAECLPSVAAACRRACERAGEDDRIVAFGSFYTVAEALRWHSSAEGA
jgi:dihydrofolate synthase/folylpolyglutamate synthase